MSTVFGVPPPPRPRVLQGGPTGPSRRTPREPVLVSRDPYPWRRRAVTLLALVSATLLLLAHLGAWLHFRALDAGAAAPATASASVDHVRLEAWEIATPVIREQVEDAYAASSTPPPPTLGDDIAAAVRAGVEGEAFAQAWEDAVRQVLEREVAAVDLGRPLDAAEPPEVPASLDLSVIGPDVRRSLAGGYPFLAGTTFKPGVYPIPALTTDDVPHELLRTVDRLWWVFLLGGVAVGAAAIAWAPRRLRLAGFLAADLVLGLAVVLLAVPLVGLVVDALAADPRHETLVEDAYGGLTGGLVVRTVVLMVLSAVAAAVCLVLARREDDRARA